jgi:hypothetical protein
MPSYQGAVICIVSYQVRQEDCLVLYCFPGSYDRVFVSVDNTGGAQFTSLKL